ncbi:MAG TPA: creatininase family protein [Thermomicrobiales bacterium]|nr:creatininase family protein [Thermomicrobiales bacterium]
MTEPTPRATTGPLLLADLSSPETGELLPTIDLVLLPVGAHEQHGPNIAVSTDTVAAEALCQAAAALVGPRVAVAPAIPWGISWHHMRFPGTITLRPATLTALLADIIGSLHAHGVQRVLVVNGHGGNTAAIASALEQIKQETEMPLLAAIFGYALIAEQAKRVLPPDAVGHAGGDEAAVVMAVAPQRAKPDAFTTPELTGRQADTAALLRQYGGLLARRYDEVTRNGATGDATAATAEAGRQILDGAAQRLAEIVAVVLREASAADGDQPSRRSAAARPAG